MVITKHSIERERENHCTQAYLSFIQHESLEIVSIVESLYFSSFDIGIRFEDPKLVYLVSFAMYRQHTYTCQALMLGG